MGAFEVRFPGGKRVDAQCPGGFVVHTDQPLDHGGDGAAPDPFTLFLASLATCAGYYLQTFCSVRRLSTEGVRLTLQTESDEHGTLTQVRLTVELPSGFPDRYVEGVRRAVDACKVKKALLHPPQMGVRVSVRTEAA